MWYYRVASANGCAGQNADAGFLCLIYSMEIGDAMLCVRNEAMAR